MTSKKFSFKLIHFVVLKNINRPQLNDLYHITSDYMTHITEKCIHLKNEQFFSHE